MIKEKSPVEETPSAMSIQDPRKKTSVKENRRSGLEAGVLGSE